MSAPDIKGWCPGAWQPMMSGDGLIVRVRPRAARLTSKQVLGLCDLAEEFGSGVMDLTNRANLQIRGVAESGHESVLQKLHALGLLDATAEAEARRNILVEPFWQADDLTARLTKAVSDALPDLPAMPAKIGIAIDTGEAPLLQDSAGDFRFERSQDGLILRADGVAKGRPVDEAEAISALIELAEWFVTRQSAKHRRMATVTAANELPAEWQATMPLAPALRPTPAMHPLGALIGAAFGQIEASALRDEIKASRATAMRVTPWRLFLLEGADMPQTNAFITKADDPLLHIDACPGAPRCTQATVETRDFARQLAPKTSGSLHISGCAKGCARKRPADTVLTGRDGRFDLIRKGCASDTPHRTGLSAEDLINYNFQDDHASSL